jgi:hypothetical protein
MELDETEVPNQPSQLQPPVTPFLPEFFSMFQLSTMPPPPLIQGCRRWPTGQLFHLLVPSPTSMCTSSHSWMRLLVAPFAAHWFPFSTECLVPLSGTIDLALLIGAPSGDLVRLPLAALLIMLNQTVSLSSLMHGHFWTLQHDKHVSMFVRVGARTYFFALMLPVYPWPPYNMPFNRSQVPGNLRR